MYKTVLKETETEIIEKKSKFIANVKNVKTEEEAIEFINEIKKKYYDARHNVFTYRINNGNERYTDDGEPSGTAGLPIIEMLKKENMTNIVVVVTRYFGGVLLGTGGLVRAYTRSAKEGILESGVVEKKKYVLISITVNYNLSGKIENYIATEKFIVEDKLYTEDVEYKIYIDPSIEGNLRNKLTDMTSNNFKITAIEEVFGYEEDGKLKKN
ncbi:MAG: IMPACT family protein [Clostridia bacterium]|jgi:uncharacterized YigZ family protein|nr:IMPACT family protein [Clostridia bacterium]